MKSRNNASPARGSRQTNAADLSHDGEAVRTERFGFLLMPGFSMLSFASLLEPLRMANRVSKKALYDWQTFSPDNAVMLPSNGINFVPSRRLEDSLDIHTMIVVAGINPLKHGSGELNAWLRGLARRGVRLGATSTGAMVLASARLLSGYKSTVHWENLDGFRERFPNITVSAELFELDRDRITCSGGTAGLDMMLHLISLHHGKALAQSVAEQCIHPQIRLAHDLQRMSVPARLNLDHPKLAAAVAHMETHMEDPLRCPTLAELVGLSQRQLERLFLSRLAATPAQYYRKMRLERATALLEQTPMSIFEVGVACGFSSASHFSTSYARVYGHTPTDVRLHLRSV